MKKIVLFFFVASLLSSTAFAQNGSWSTIDSHVVLKGGYNILERHSVFSVAAVGEIAFCRFAFELQYPNFDSALRKINYPIFFSPSIGFCYGEKNVVYLMAGVQPWVLWDNASEKFVDEKQWRPKLEIGYDIRLSDVLFINLSALYLIPFQSTYERREYKNLTVLCGLGFRL